MAKITEERIKNILEDFDNLEIEIYKNSLYIYLNNLELENEDEIIQIISELEEINEFVEREEVRNFLGVYRLIFRF